MRHQTPDPQIAYSLGELTRVAVRGKDAATILHNVTTNDVKKLEIGQGCETFVTDVRGKTIGHGFVFRGEAEFVLLGAPDQADRLIAHLDKYTIREDATPIDQSNAAVAYLVQRSAKLMSSINWSHQMGDWKSPSGDRVVFAAPLISQNSCVVFAQADAGFREDLQVRGMTILNEDAFHAARTLFGYPWYGIDLDDRNLPQELDRDECAVSFTKGCYLGQETVARLDALGQVQRKWVRLEFSDTVPDVGMIFEHAGKPVCRISSVAQTEHGAVAYGFARRSHFNVGASLIGKNQAGQDVCGTVAG